MRSLLARWFLGLLGFPWLFVPAAQAFEDPTKGQPFFPWLWNDQLKPTLSKSVTPGNLALLGGGTLATVTAFQYEHNVYEHNRQSGRQIMSDETAGVLGRIGGGAFGIGIAGAQLFLDQENGLMHSRAILLTSLSHVSLAYLVGKKRPGGRGDYLPFASSFPSGHASSAFATAGSLAYAYGYKVGVPAFALATAIATARVSENAHWLSDVVAGATLGLLWARASFNASAKEVDVSWMIFPLENGALLQLSTHTFSML